MTSENMDKADLCPTEDALLALFKYLIDPWLPSKSSVWSNLSHVDQEIVAKQVHAVVVLYNYYHRQQHPQLEFLGFEDFCKLAVTLRPALLSHMKLMQVSSDIELEDPENQLSLLEKKIMDACDVSMSLDASKNAPNMERWPISKVAVLLVDSGKENCILQFSSIIEGVWSMIEKDVHGSIKNLKGSMDLKHTNKRKRIIRKPLKDESGADEACFQVLAFSAVQEAIGIDQSELMVLESRIAYSLSKERAAVRFYILQCTKPNTKDIISFPIKDAISSLQGRLIMKDSCQWKHTPAVEYFHLLPYAGILLDWLSREGLHTSLPVQIVGNVNVDSSSMAEKSGEMDIPKGSNGSNVDGVVVHIGSNARSVLPNQDANGTNGHFGSKKSSDLSKRIDCDGSKDMIGDYDEPCNINAHDLSFVHAQIEAKERNIAHEFQHENHETIAERRCLSVSVAGENIKVEMTSPSLVQAINEHRGGDFANGKKNCNVCPDQDMMSLSNCDLVPHQSNSEDLEKLCTVIASKDKELSQVALNAILSKRDKLSFQQREIEDQIARCDKMIQKIFNGGEGDLALKIESIIEACSDVDLRSVIRERGYQHCEEQVLPQHVKRKKLLDTVVNVQNPCQALDDACYEKNWILPTYKVCLLDGGFQANVTVKGMNVEYSSKGDLRLSPREARESAAAQMLAKLGNLPSIVQTV